MTKIILKTLIIIILMIRCNAAQPISDENCSVENLECAEDLTQIAEYPYGHTEFIANFQGLTVDKGFQVVVDSQFKVKVQNFISPLETHFRKKIQELDALLVFDTYKGLKTVSAAQKRKSILQERNWCQKRADSLHFANNRGQQQVLLINNSNDTVYLSLRDGSLSLIHI
jgi:hypothetical protein